VAQALETQKSKKAARKKSKKNKNEKRHKNKKTRKNKKKKKKKKKKKQHKKHGDATRTERACEGAANTYALQCASLSTGAHGMRAGLRRSPRTTRSSRSASLARTMRVRWSVRPRSAQTLAHRLRLPSPRRASAPLPLRSLKR
jgi:hypothetical protein